MATKKVSVTLYQNSDPQKPLRLAAPTAEELTAKVERRMKVYRWDTCLKFDPNDQDLPQHQICWRGTDELVERSDDCDVWEVTHYDGDDPFHQIFETFEDALALWLTFVPAYIQ